MAYLNVDNVNSFPSTKRASVNKLMTENSVTRLINRLIDTDSFVITNGIDSGNDFLTDISVSCWDQTFEFEFVIRGYYFSISHKDYASGLSFLQGKLSFNPQDQIEHTLYAGIFIDKSDKNFPELFGQENSPDNEYKAIAFYIDGDAPNEPDGYDPGELEFYSIPLVKYKQQEDGKWGKVVPLTSLFKFSSKSISNIDGGEINISSN